MPEIIKKTQHKTTSFLKVSATKKVSLQFQNWERYKSNNKLKVKKKQICEHEKNQNNFNFLKSFRSIEAFLK